MVQMDTLVSLCKRRGIIFQSSEIYGGINGFWDFGPVGVELKRRIKESWWRYMVTSRDNVVGVDTSIICHPRVWEASGHVNSFSDPMVDCKSCKKRFRADEPDLQQGVCPACSGELTDPKEFNLMFHTQVGARSDSASTAYLRPETCQPIFVQFKQIQVASRKKVPFGIAQIGKAFRNEITPRNFIFRSREFEQMEMEFFTHADESEKWFEFWVNERFSWFSSIGINESRLRRRPHDANELAHYAKGCTDVEYEMPFGWSEMEGIANRSNYDLQQHMDASGKDMMFFDDARKEKYLPYVIETSIGVDRTALAILCDAYREETVNDGKRVVLGLHPSIAPIQVAMLPLSNKLKDAAKNIEKELRKEFVSEYDDAGSIGKRYRRHDEIGTPFCVTFDFDSLDDNAVTIRHRDTMAQERIAMSQLADYLRKKLV